MAGFRVNLIEGYKDFVYVSLGSIAGSYLRITLIKLISLRFSSAYFSTILVNSLACLLFGMFVTIYIEGLLLFDSFNYLFFITGFLGSLSTFSGFILDQLNLIMNNKWRESIFAIIISLLSGIILISLGLIVVN